jgi:hypothetical protein
MADQYISTRAAHGLPGGGLDIPANAIDYAGPKELRPAQVAPAGNIAHEEA